LRSLGDPMNNAQVQVEIDVLISRFFSAFDNRNGARPRSEHLTDCFTEKAIVVRRSEAGTQLCTVGEFATPRIELLTRGALRDFHEWEVSSTTQIFDGIATRTSRYSKSGLLEGNTYSGSGTKCFQLVSTNRGWRIASLAWVDDHA
jgi:ribosomal-protein-serine acetyltransferase